MRILIFSEDDRGREFFSGLARKGYSCSMAVRQRRAAEQIAEHTPNLALIAGGTPERVEELSRQVKRNGNLPIIAILDPATLGTIGGYPELVDDFATNPCTPEELDLRIQRLLGKRAGAADGDRITCGDLLIDIAKCEVTIGGRAIMLTFKEYQLLKFLAGSPGRVFTREALLNNVWGYEYYGGDRTVDVHIKRLRSKIEDANHSFVETVRNIGYRFRDDL